ncbi:hypothetical protein BJ508DRAFT_156549 [Ascobolus immersus RN42]|uniref:Uncharacterized protein n=1 Tax=Ascobolus immersus RN42 TaxID=1160509 RepID=A0A3N4I9D4_ASCIM|nr:hypothetical protein BJ508DRAFT_156549 [Ascobolus immersus RN42]
MPHSMLTGRPDAFCWHPVLETVSGCGVGGRTGKAGGDLVVELPLLGATNNNRRHCGVSFPIFNQQQLTSKGHLYDNLATDSDCRRKKRSQAMIVLFQRDADRMILQLQHWNDEVEDSATARIASIHKRLDTQDCLENRMKDSIFEYGGWIVELDGFDFGILRVL